MRVLRAQQKNVMTLNNASISTRPHDLEPLIILPTVAPPPRATFPSSRAVFLSKQIPDFAGSASVPRPTIGATSHNEAFITFPLLPSDAGMSSDIPVRIRSSSAVETSPAGEL